MVARNQQKFSPSKILGYTVILKYAYTLEMQQYGSTPYCILPLSVLQYIAVLQYLTSCL